MESKKCPVCQKQRDMEEFRRMTGLQNKFNKTCRTCIKPIKERNDAEKAAIKEKQKAYREANREKLNAYKVQWRQENRELVNKATGDRLNRLYSEDPAFKARAISRIRMRNLISKAFEFDAEFGCSFEQFKIYIESKWIEGMSWSNYGKGKGCWNIDHIRPLDGVNDEGKSHYSNLQPLWLEDNSRKGNK